MPVPGADHDNRSVGVLRQTKSVRGLDENGNGGAGIAAVGEKNRTNAFALAAMCFIPHRRDRQMHFIRMRLRARGNGVKAGWKFAQEPDEFRRAKFYRWISEQNIDHFAAVKPLVEFGFVAGFKQTCQSGIAGTFSDRLQQRPWRAGNGIGMPQRVIE
jgi:hypothetical protein